VSNDTDDDAEGVSQETKAGRCQCGAVSYSVNGPLRPVVNCHCHRCRRITGHFMAATSALVTDVEVTDSGALSWYEAAEGVFYGFCSTCGSSLFWKVGNRPERLSICAGTLDPPTGLDTTVSIWMAEVSDYHLPQSGLAEHEYGR